MSMIIPWLILGQLSSYYLNISNSIIFFLFGLSLIRKFPYQNVIIVFILGMFSANSIKGSNFADKEIRKGILVEAISYIKVKNTRDLSLKLKVLDVHRDSPAYIKDLINKKIVCTSSNIPWRNIKNIKKGSLFYIGGRFKNIKQKPFSSYRLSLLNKGYKAKCKISYVSHELVSKYSLIDSLREKISKKAINLSRQSEAGAIFLSMSVGVSDFYSENVWRVFKETGLAHLLVVSGYQVTLVYCSIFLFFFSILVKYKSIVYRINVFSICAIVGTVVAVLYTILVGLDSACLRALIALIFISYSRIVSRQVSFFNSILSSLFVMLLIWPLCIFEPGVQLTFSALIGISIGTMGEARSLYKYLRICFWATLLSSIVTIYWFDNFYLISFLTNILLAPIASIISCQIGFLAILLSLLDFNILLEICIYLTDIFYKVLCWLKEVYAINLSSNLVQLVLFFIAFVKFLIILVSYICTKSLYVINRSDSYF